MSKDPQAVWDVLEFYTERMASSKTNLAPATDNSSSQFSINQSTNSLPARSMDQLPKSSSQASMPTPAMGMGTSMPNLYHAAVSGNVHFFY